MGGPAAPAPQLHVALEVSGATAADNLIMDAWFNLTDRGAGGIAAANLTDANARSEERSVGKEGNILNNAGDIRVVHPDGVTGNVDGFAAINALGNKNTLALRA